MPSGDWVRATHRFSGKSDRPDRSCNARVGYQPPNHIQFRQNFPCGKPDSASKTMSDFTAKTFKNTSACGPRNRHGSNRWLKARDLITSGREREVGEIREFISNIVPDPNES